ncbi:MAG TPA: hypothetical protein VKY31_09965 [Terriglobia bacterium]|nr:hypothetical protein [Terriglobia bacterium]
MNFLRERSLSAAASDLVEFDADSIRRLGEADVWVADPDAYEKNGRVLRDSETPRMLAYSSAKHVLYATDGCNSCAIAADLKAVSNLKEFAEENEVPLDLLERLTSLL